VYPNTAGLRKKEQQILANGTERLLSNTSVKYLTTEFWFVRRLGVAQGIHAPLGAKLDSRRA
jgi:hypothetical protein